MIELFEWDATKEQGNLAKHGVDFRRAIQIFDSHFIETVDARREYGELWLRCLGEIDGRVYHVVYTWRGPNRRIISARKANERETRSYRSYDRGGGTPAR